MENKKRLIDEFKNELMSEFIRLCNGNDFKKLTLLKIGDVIDRLYEKYSTIPTVDAAPVVRGRWEPELMPTGVEYSGWAEMTVQALSCSVCGKCIDVSEGYFSYCPNCGAKMDLKEE